MLIEETSVDGFVAALRGMRNPMNSWDKSDSNWGWDYSDIADWFYVIGPNDMELAQKLIKAGPEHCKFLRFITVSMDITAPLYWWKEYDTYKVGTVANSCSTMHKLCSKPIELTDFEIDNQREVLQLKNGAWNYMLNVSNYWDDIIRILNYLITSYKETKDKQVWRTLIQLLPEAYLQKRTEHLNYAVLRNMYHQRKNHKLTEWRDTFCGWIKQLPYADEFITYEN